MDRFINYKIDGTIGIISLNDRTNHNALSSGLLEELLKSLELLKKEKVRVAILRAKKGITVWSAGHNIQELPKNSIDPLSYNIPMRKVIRNIQSMPYPIIAMVEGSVWGGACEVVMSCDIIVADKKSTFAITGIPSSSFFVLTIFVNKSMLIPIEG